MGIRRSDIVINTGDLIKVKRAFMQFPSLLLSTLPPSLRKESGSFLREVRSGVKARRWADFTQTVTTRRIPKKSNEVGIRVKPKNNLASVFEHGFSKRRVKKKNVPRPVYFPAWKRYENSNKTTIRETVIREGKAQMMRLLLKNGIRF